MNLFKSNFKFQIIFIVVSLIFMYSINTRAEEAYNPYFRVGINYILAQPDHVTSTGKERYEIELYQKENFAYNIEWGISVPIEDGNALHLGVYWYDLINQGKSSELHRPYKLEVFSDYAWEWNNGIFSTIGVGYKLFQDLSIDYIAPDGTPNKMDLANKPLIDNITARIAIGRHFGKYSLSLEHHSQWLNGKPFDRDWEYFTTNINLTYVF